MSHRGFEDWWFTGDPAPLARENIYFFFCSDSRLWYIMSYNYIDTLDPRSRERYELKLNVIGCEECPYRLPALSWSSDPLTWPTISYPDIFNYLVTSPGKQLTLILKVAILTVIVKTCWVLQDLLFSAQRWAVCLVVSAQRNWPCWMVAVATIYFLLFQVYSQGQWCATLGLRRLGSWMQMAGWGRFSP